MLISRLSGLQIPVLDFKCRTLVSFKTLVSKLHCVSKDLPYEREGS